MDRGTRRLSTRGSAFWDASALVPLCIRQSVSNTVSVLHQNYSVVVWWGTRVEVESALTREHRMAVITHVELQLAKRTANILEQSWSEIVPSVKLRANAQKLLNNHALRAADALQLSAALEWCESEPAGRPFFTADGRLREAARLSGFDVSQL